MNLKDLIGLFRSETDSKEQDQLWPKDEVVEFANDAVNEACRRARLIVDSTTKEIVEVSFSANKPYVELDERIIFVRRARVTTLNTYLTIASYRDLDCYPGWENWTGMPSRIVTDLETGKLRFDRIPTTAGKIVMTVVRLPMCEMNDDEDVPEINSRYHRSLRYWMLYRGYSKKDIETEDPGEAAKNEAAFEREFGTKSAAIEEEWIMRQQQYDQYDGTF